MRREVAELRGTAVGDRAVLVYGHYGQPVLAFASDSGWAHDFEANGMLDAVACLVE